MRTEQVEIGNAPIEHCYIFPSSKHNQHNLKKIRSFLLSTKLDEGGVIVCKNAIHHNVANTETGSYSRIKSVFLWLYTSIQHTSYIHNRMLNSAFITFQIVPTICQSNFLLNRAIHSTSVCLSAKKAGKYKITKNKNFPLTYEMANAPQHIQHRKTWNSFNSGKCF